MLVLHGGTAEVARQRQRLHLGALADPKVTIHLKAGRPGICERRSSLTLPSPPCFSRRSRHPKVSARSLRQHPELKSLHLDSWSRMK